MSKNYVNLTIPYVWELKEHTHIKITKSGMVINVKRGNILKYTTRGFYIDGNYYKRKELRKMAQKPKIKICPF